ncbi:MAG TPA: hypothetical protein VGH14_12045 [Solirubrobacterales bacterium]|jgi:hypothetical protein
MTSKDETPGASKPKTTAERESISDAAQRIVERTCTEQGLPVKVTDPVVIGKIAAIFSVQSRW